MSINRAKICVHILRDRYIFSNISNILVKRIKSLEYVEKLYYLQSNSTTTIAYYNIQRLNISK